MNIHEKFNIAKELTIKHNQQQLLQFYDKLSPESKEKLLDQIFEIDFDLTASLYDNLVKEGLKEEGFKDLAPLDAYEWDKYSDTEKKKFYNAGMNLLIEGKVACILVAGGQGTRLGHNGPKGIFKIGLPSDKSLFQLQTERMLNLSLKAGHYIPWYIMTSPENHNDTVKFFKDNVYFGYPEDYIFFFKQDLLPVVDKAGRILLNNEDSISMGPSGNGGCFLALEKHGLIKDMKKRGIKWVYLYGVDNALVKVADPSFIGFAHLSGLPSASKVVKKKYPEEKVGVFCYKDKKPAIVEYSELPEELRYMTKENGELAYSSSNIISHIFSLEVLERYSTCSLPYHIAFKKIPFIDSEGNIIQVKEPNAYKFELFIFDIFPVLDDMAALAVKREEEFAPVKNAEGEDSPKTARDLLLNLYKKWVIKAGMDAELLHDVTFDISPLTSYEGENINLDQISQYLLHKKIIIM